MDMISEATAVARHDACARADPGKYLSFHLGAEQYGIGILHVQEIRSYEAPTRIANAAPHVKGVVNLRGVIVPIVDLRLRLGCASAAYDASTVVIVLNLHERVTGAVVDSVSDVVELTAAQIKPPPRIDTPIDNACITGIGCVGEGEAQRMLILVDIDGLVSDTLHRVPLRTDAREADLIGR